ncbi:MAG: hypothetical protein NZM00_01850 [Anaerolinea sp.]|nr:hypothetical protein [Anaerolinea sp.]
MNALPRIITVDPSRTVARIVRSVLDLTDRTAVQIDVPTGSQALIEIGRGDCRVLVAAFKTDDDVKGFELALRAHQISPQTAVILLADADDPVEMDAETRAQSPFVYLHRPVDIHQFMRVLLAGLDGKDIFAAYDPPVTRHGLESLADLSEPPSIDLKAAERICDRVLQDVSAKTVLLYERTGRVLIERGAVGYIDRARLGEALLPGVLTTIEMGKLVGGNITTMTIYDGDTYDVFVLAVGLHHFMSLIFDGQTGSRQMGGVTRYGRRAAEDLITLLGSAAYRLENRVVPPEDMRRRHPHEEPQEEPVEPVILARAEELTGELPAVVLPEPIVLEPIADLDPSLLDELTLASIDPAALDELFDPNKLAELANDSRSRRGPLSYEEARELGIIP